ncbi:SIR2 family protein [Halarcobacter sp.]|uniref:SIR2 family protein n=1 Tax=Halarcobacter sp. TaxID=2321133 RepID=UPI003A952A3D
MPYENSESLSKLINKYLQQYPLLNIDKYISIFNEGKVTQEQKIETISTWYKAQRLVMVLGAGSSVSYGLPNWNTLLQKILLITLEADKNKNQKEKAEVLAKTFSAIFEPNSLISARYLHKYFQEKNPKSQLAFENAIRDTLYESLKAEEDSILLKEIRQFCIAAGRSPNLDSIITYNYDDILEECLKNIPVDIPFTPIYARGMRHEQYQLPIYHVHGYLPRKGNLTKNNKIILGEDEYHQQYNDSYGWNNLIQINKFKDFNCIFIGVSFSDPNLRRLLDIAKNERGDDKIHHYCFKKKYDKNQIKKRLEKLLSENDDILSEKNSAQIEFEELTLELISLMEKFEEHDASSFGVGIIWISSYDEIPNLLQEIRIHNAH